MQFDYSSIAADSVIFVEGGHFTLRPERTVAKAKLPPGTYYFEVESGLPEQQSELFRVPVKGDRYREWLVVSHEKEEGLDVSSYSITGDMFRVGEPSETELGTLKDAVDSYQILNGKKFSVTLFLLIGDLHLPPELRTNNEWMIPNAFQNLFLGADFKLLLSGESRCRNKGFKKFVKSARSKIGDVEFMSDLYERTGATIIQDDDPDLLNTFIASESLLKNAPTDFPVIAMSKSPTMPSCAATIAGKIQLLKENGCTHYFAWHDDKDDGLIRHKHIEGAIIASLMLETLDMYLYFISLRSRRVIGEDSFIPADFKVKNPNGDYEDLKLRALRAGRRHGIEIIGSLAPADCCPYPASSTCN